MDFSQLNGLTDGGAQPLLGIDERVAKRTRLGNLGYGRCGETLGVESAQLQLKRRIEVAADFAIVAQEGIDQGNHACGLR